MRNETRGHGLARYQELLSYSIPATASLLIEMLTSLTDALFAGALPGEGVDALSAITLASPVFGISMALQSVFAMPVAVLAARHHGNALERDRYLSLSLLLCLITTGACGAVLLLQADGVARLTGASGATAKLLRTYLTVQAASNIASAVGFTLTTAIRAGGRPMAETAITTASVAVNVALDVILAFALDMGMAGLALATLGSELFCAAAAAATLARMGGLPSIPRAFDPGALGRCAEILKIGVAQSASQILSSVTGAAMNSAVAARGMGHVAAWGAAQRVYGVAIVPLVGISQGAQTVLARSGEGGSRPVIVLSCMVGAATSALVTAFGTTLCAPLAPSGAVLQLARGYCSTCSMGLAFLGLAQALSAIAIARERPSDAMPACIAKQATLALAAAVAGTDPMASVAAGVPLSDIAGAAAALAMHGVRSRKRG